MRHSPIFLRNRDLALDIGIELKNQHLTMLADGHMSIRTASEVQNCESTPNILWRELNRYH